MSRFNKIICLILDSLKCAPLVLVIISRILYTILIMPPHTKFSSTSTPEYGVVMQNLLYNGMHRFSSTDKGIASKQCSRARKLEKAQ